MKLMINQFPPYKLRRCFGRLGVLGASSIREASGGAGGIGRSPVAFGGLYERVEYSPMRRLQMRENGRDDTLVLMASFGKRPNTE